MTEKRFTRDDDTIYDNGEFLYDLTILLYHNADDVVEFLNELHEQIEQFKKMYCKLYDEYLEFRRAYFQERELDLDVIEKIRNYPVEYYENPYTITHEEKE